jgi:glucose-6-phosphate dehydrogenase assembly protein OpcA
MLQTETGIDIGAIEKELNALWTDLGSDREGVIRSCVLNLIILSRSKGPNASLEESLIEITEKHPSRAILVLADSEETNARLEAWVTSRCSLSQALSKRVCCEQISISASGPVRRECQSAVSSLILADLPVYFWARDGVPLSDPLFRRFSEFCDRILVDSSGPSVATRTGLDEISSYIRSTSRQTPLMDLNWSRLVTWRALAADFFDVADYRPLLDRLDAIEVRYRGDTPRAFYLVSWLATRLGWTVKNIEKVHDDISRTFLFDAKGRDVRVTLTREAGGSATFGNIEEVVLASGNDARFSIRKTEDRSRLSWEVDLKGHRRFARVLGHDQWTDAELVSRELEILGRDRVFEKSAELAYTLSTMK